MQFYLIIPFIVAICEALRPKPVVFGSTLAFSIAAIIAYKLSASHGHNLGNWHAMIYQPLIVNLDVFLVGVAAAYAVEALRHRGITFRAGLQLGGGLLLVLYLVTAYVSPAVMIVSAS